MAPDFVTVVIPAYNAGRFLTDAIGSALAQTHAAREIVVIDDGSTDDTPAVAARFGDAIRWVRKENGGPARARNDGIRLARGELVAFLDADDVWLPHKLERQIAKLAERPHAALVHSLAYNVLSDGSHRELRTPEASDYSGDCLERLFHGNRITFSTVVARKACLEEVGGFDESLRQAAIEDYDLLLRLASRYPFTVVAEPLIHYRIHGANGSADRWNMFGLEAGLIERVVERDPNIRAKLSRRSIDRRLHDLHLGLAYRAREEGNRPLARRHFFRAARAGRPLQCRLLGCAEYLPHRLTNGLRSLKRWWQGAASS
jgi:glycosyltransferase involved in cell wall biosynthesis